MKPHWWSNKNLFQITITPFITLTGQVINLCPYKLDDETNVTKY